MPVSRSGFTLLELMIVLVIIGLLAAIGIPLLSAGKDRAYVSSMKHDLRNLSTFQESYFYDTSIYTTNVNVLTNNGYQLTNGISVNIVEATVSGWSATSTHALSPVQCALFVGSAAPVGAATTEGLIACQ